MLQPLTSFFDRVVKPAKSIDYFLLCEQYIPKYVKKNPIAGNAFIYIYLNNTYQIWLLKTGCMGCLIAHIRHFI